MKLKSAFSIIQVSIRIMLPVMLWLALTLPAWSDVIYTVEEGDSAWSIAVDFGISLDALYEANGWASDENPVLRIGQKIAIPSARENADSSSSKTNSSEGYSGETTYIVQNGDVLSLIAEHFGTTTSSLLEYNGLDADDFLMPGQLLSIPPSDYSGSGSQAEEIKSPAPEPVHYRVQAEDTPWEIARNYGVNLETLLAFNNLSENSILQIGDELLIPVEAGQLASRSNNWTRHIVRAGDTLGGIARNYGSTTGNIAEANNITESTLLRVGQELVIPVYRSTTQETTEASVENTGTEPANTAMVEDLSAELAPLPDLSEIELTETDISGWHSEIFDFTMIEAPEPVGQDPANVATAGFSIDGYFSDGTPYHLYPVRRGDTLGDVAHAFGVTQSELREFNGLDSRSTLRIGRDLKIPLPQPVAIPASGSGNSSASDNIRWGAPNVPIGSGPGTATGQAVVDEAMKYLGTPYVYGGNSLTGGIDCSGFTSAIYRMFGISLYRSARDQEKNGTPVEYADLKPGDIVLFHTTRPGISHAGMYIGNGNFIHSSSHRGGVVISPLDSGYYNERFVCARRVID